MQPRAHYRFLPPFLRALDRVVSVSSSTGVFPLPQAVVPASTGILNGITPTTSTTASATNAGLGSDESLGGALLTPIPWLQSREARAGSANGNSELVSESTEMVDGPNGAGRIETVSVVNGVLSTGPAPAAGAATPPSSTTTSSSGASPVATPTSTAGSTESLRDAGAVTQGELLRQEQEAGVVPVGQSNPRNRGLLAGGAGAASSEQKEGEEKADEEDQQQQQEDIPHARGPEEVGVEDMGPQERGPGGGINLEAAVGRAPVASSSSSSAVKKEDEGEEGKDVKPEQPQSPEAEMKDVDEEKEGEKEVKTEEDKAKKEDAEENEKKEGEAKGSDTEMTD